MKNKAFKSILDLIKAIFINHQAKTFKVNVKLDETPLEKKLEK